MSKVETLGLPPYDRRKVGVAFDLPAGQDPDAAIAHLQVLADAFSTYLERNVKYKDNWRKMGWKGTIVRCKERVDRLWDNLWERSPEELGPVQSSDLDDAYDLINFAAFLIRGAGAGEATASGEWRW